MADILERRCANVLSAALVNLANSIPPHDEAKLDVHDYVIYYCVSTTPY